MYYGYYDSTWLLLIPAVIFTLYAQLKVKRAYKLFSGVQNRTKTTGLQAARRILDANGLQDVAIEMTEGKLTDHYDPRSRVMRLSAQVYQDTTIASVSIAAHEAGHAIQHGVGYKFLTFRNTMAPAATAASWLSWILIVVGFIVGVNQGLPWGDTLLDIGILCFILVVLFHLVTLPVELNASSRAIAQLQGLGIVGSEEIRGSKKVLSAAAMTYVAALASAVLSLIRLLIIRGER